MLVSCVLSLLNFATVLIPIIPDIHSLFPELQRNLSFDLYNFLFTSPSLIKHAFQLCYRGSRYEPAGSQCPGGRFFFTGCMSPRL